MNNFDDIFEPAPQAEDFDKEAWAAKKKAEEEAAAVDAWMSALDWKKARVTACRQSNKPSRRETLYLARKIESIS